MKKDYFISVSTVVQRTYHVLASSLKEAYDLYNLALEAKDSYEDVTTSSSVIGVEAPDGPLPDFPKEFYSNETNTANKEVLLEELKLAQAAYWNVVRKVEREFGMETLANVILKGIPLKTS